MTKFEAGQTVLIRCDPRMVRVDDTYGDLVAVRWPWGTPDPDSRYAWDGTVAVPTDPLSLEWVQTPWRVEPRAGLQPGDVCQLLVPAALCRVVDFRVFDDPEDVGALPRPTADLLGLLVVAGFWAPRKALAHALRPDSLRDRRRKALAATDAISDPHRRAEAWAALAAHQTLTAQQP